MNMTKKAGTVILGSVLALVMGSASVMAVAADKEAASSGFLDAKVEAKLKEKKLKSGSKVMRWISSDVNGKNYKAVMVDRAIFYPAPSPGPKVSSSTLDAIAEHMTSALKDKLEDRVSVVDKAGPGVLRIQPAFTAVSVEKEGMSAMDIVPVHLLFTAAKHASGSADFDTKAQLEIRITDSVSGDYRAAVKMDLEGKKVDKDADLTLGDVQKTLDKTAADGAATIRKALK